VWPFKRRIKLEVTDTEAQKQNFIKAKRTSPSSLQECYKVFLRYHKRGSTFNPRRIYFLYNGKLQSTSRG